MNIRMNLNGQHVCVDVDPMYSLLHVLRERLHLTATKESCGEGECGACSVIMNGKLVNSCILPIGQAEGAEVLTLEGVRETEKGRCIVNAILDAKGVQCGFCSPGMVLALYVLLDHNADPSESDIRIALSGNLCRCTGYSSIIEAAKIAAKQGSLLW